MLQFLKSHAQDNVFVSIVESYSTDGTPILLDAFASSLARAGVQHKIVLRDTSVRRPVKILSNNARVEFLAATRNIALEPLRALPSFVSGRILFSNDVWVSAESVIELLRTRDGQYDMACGLDFDGIGLYDVWVMRDRLGGLVSSLWPYIIEDAGRIDIENDRAASVFTCWNGIVAVRAEPLLSPHLRDNTTSLLSSADLPRPLPPSHPAYTDYQHTPPRSAPALKFRASSPRECFSSESFLFPYDLRRQFMLEDIYVNPRVITAYQWKHYFWNKYVLRHWLVLWWMRNFERGDGMHRAKFIISKEPRNVSVWDGGHCQGGESPWSAHSVG